MVVGEVFLIICFKINIRAKGRKESAHCATFLRNMTMTNEYIINRYHVCRKKYGKATFEKWMNALPKHDGHLTSRGFNIYSAFK